MIVAIEGGDASGKATQSSILANKLNAELISFPDYTTPTGEKIISLLKEDWTSGYKIRDNFILQCLMTVNRLELFPRINRAIQEKRSIVFDRYWASGIVYGGLDGLDVEWIKLIQAPLPKPDHWFLIDVPVSESVKRRPERRDRYEKDIAFAQKVRAAYVNLFIENHWTIIDGLGTIEEVTQRICKFLKWSSAA